jgi:elongation factor Ts
MQCKKALEDAGGDEEKAMMYLRKKGADVAAKKSDRELTAGVISAYIHSNGSMGAMIQLSSETDFVSNNAEFKTLAYDIAMHISASNPEYVSMDQIGEAEIAKAKDFFKEEVVGKPADLQEKILQGKLDAFFKERVLLEQPFIKNPDLTVKQLIDNAIQKFGEKIEVSQMARFTTLR